MHRITEHDGTVSLLYSCLHGNAESGDNLEASRRPLDFVEALRSVEETEKGRTSQSWSGQTGWHFVNGAFLSTSSLQNKPPKKYLTYISTRFRTSKVQRLERTEVV